MMLWDIIRDWFVQYVWGGHVSGGNRFSGMVGYFTFLDDAGEIDETLAENTDTFLFKINGFLGYNHGIDTPGFLSIGDWLSTTSTIIVLLGICIFLYLVTKYLFKFVAGLFKW